MLTYNEFIQNIINTRGQWVKCSDYIEQHHIQPVCLGGKGDFKNNRFRKNSNHINCIWLTAAEHFIAHKLLAIENKTNFNIVHAYCMMCDCTAAKSNKRSYDVTPEDYELCKQLRVNMPLSEEVREKIRQAKLGKKLKSTTGIARQGKHYYTNGIENKMFFETEVPDSTWKRVNRAKPKKPKIKKSRPLPTAQSNQKRSETMKAKALKWFTNGIDEIRAVSCPDGYHRGRSNRIKENNSIKCKTRDLHLIGERNGMYGKHHSAESNKKRSDWGKGRHWYNNGVIQVFERECPEGFKPGRLSGKNKCK